MSAGNYNITCEQYATFSLVITWKDSAGNPIDLTGYSAAMDVKECSTVIVSLTTDEDGGITLGGEDGTITLYISAEDTSELSPGTYTYDLLLTDGDDVVTRLIQGAFTVAEGVTA